MKKLKIGKSDIHGKGLFTGEPIRKGDLIAKVHSGIQLDPETVKYMPTQYGRFYNHDEKKFNTTNEIIGNHRYLRAIKNIPANTELTANYREHSDMEQPENFGQGKYASFDFDKTIATDEGLAKARQMLKDGYNLFIVSARDKVTPDMVARARKAGIPEENIIATGSDEAKVRKVKQLGVEKHFDDKPEVIAALGLVGEQFKKGGGLNSKKYTRSITGTNKLFTKNNLFKKKSTKRIYDPNAKYYAEGGESGCPDGFEEDPQTGECIPIREKVEDIQEMPRPIVQKPPYYQESFVNPAAYVSGYRGGDPRMYKYGFLDSDQGQIIGGGGFGFPKPGVHLNALGVLPMSADDRQYFKGAYEAGISKDIKNLNLGLGVGTAITGYPGENGFVRDPIKLQPKLNLKYNFAEGGASGCPPGQYWNGKKCTKLISYATDKKLIDGVSNWAMQSSNPDKISSEYNDQIKHYLYSGKYGYDPVSMSLIPLSTINKKLISEPDQETKKILAKQDDKAAYTQSIIDAGFDPDTFGKSKGTNVITGEQIYGDRSQEDVDKINKEAVDNFVTEGHRKAILESPFNTAAFFTPAGMAAGVIQGAANLLPDVYDFGKDPSWSGAGAIGMDALMMSPAAKGIGKFLGTESGVLSNTYKHNPWAFKPNPESAYRMIGGKEGYLDAINSGEIRAMENGIYGDAHFNMGLPLNPNRLSSEELIKAGSPGGYKGPYMVERRWADNAWNKHAMTDSFKDNPEMFQALKDLGKDKDVWGKYGNLETNDNAVRLYKEHWLKGYKEVPKQLPGSPNAVDNVQKAGFLNPLALIDRITPRLPAITKVLGMEDDVVNWSPLNLIPGYGKKLAQPGFTYPINSGNTEITAYRKFGNSLDDLKNSKTFRPQGGFRMGANQIKKEGNWAESGIANENYKGVFAASMDPRVAGTNIQLQRWSKRNGVVGMTKQGNPAIPITDSGFELHRRLPWSNRYVPIDKQKLIDNKFQLATQLPHVQSLIEKYGIAAAYGLISGYLANGKEGAIENLKTVNKYTVDPVINWSNTAWDDLENKLNQKKDGGIIADFSRDQIQEYINGGYIVEELDDYANGGEPCPEGFQEDPITGECVVITERTQDIQEVSTNQYSPYIAAYEEAHPRDQFVYHKKADYLRKNKGLNKMAGLSQDNFNTDVEGNFNSNWEYDRNSEVIKQFAKDHGINPKNHVELVEKMADKGNVSRDMIANSKYGSKLQPSLWARSLAGAQELGNFVVKQLPGEQGDVFNKQTAGLTKKEWDEIHNSSTGALETLSATDIPGAVIGNALSDLSTATGGNYQESPGIFSGELKSNMDPLKAALLNPALYAGLAEGLVSAPKIAASASNLYKGAKGIGKFLDTESGLLSNASKINPWAGTFEGESLLPKGLQFNKLDDPEAFYRLTKDPKNYGLGVDSYFNKGVPLTGDLANTFPKGSRAFGHRYSGPKYNQQTGKIDEYFGKDYLFKVEDESLMKPFLNFPEEHLTFYQQAKEINPSSSQHFQKDWLKGWTQIPQNKHGGLHKFVGGGPTDCGEGMVWSDELQDCVKSTVQAVDQVRTNQYSPYAVKYDQMHPQEREILQKKAEYLSKHKGLNRIAGVTQDNFPEKVLRNIINQVDYERNNYIIDQYSKAKGFNPNKHVQLVENIAEKGRKSYDMAQNSKYGSKLKPSLWARTLAGAQELGNFVVKQLPGTQGDVFKYEVPGLSKKERKEIANSKTGALETFAVGNLPGQAIANTVLEYGKTLTGGTGADYKTQDIPNVVSGEYMPGVDDDIATVFNPLTYTGLTTGLMGAPNMIRSALPMAKNIFTKGKTMYTDIAEGANMFDYAWKSPAARFDKDAVEFITDTGHSVVEMPESTSLFNKLKTNPNLTADELATIKDYEASSFSYRSGPNKEKLDAIIKKSGLTLDEPTVMSRRINTTRTDNFDPVNGIFNTKRPTSWSAGRDAVGNNLYSGSGDRMVMKLQPGEYNMLKNPYLENSPETLDALIKMYEPMGNLEQRMQFVTGKPRIAEREVLLGSGTDLKQIGKVKNNFGGFDYIMKNLNKKQYGGLHKFIDGGQPCPDGYTWDETKQDCVSLIDTDWLSNWYANRKLPLDEIPNKKYVNLMRERLPQYNPESTLLEELSNLPPVEYQDVIDDDPNNQGQLTYDKKYNPDKILLKKSLLDDPVRLNQIYNSEASTAVDVNKPGLFAAQNMVIDPGLVLFEDRWGDLKGSDRDVAEDHYNYTTDPEQDNIHSLIFEERYKRNLKPDQVLTETDINKWKSEAEASGALDRNSPNFDDTLYTLFKLAKDNKSLMNWFNQLASNDKPKTGDEPQYTKQGGSIGYKIGDEIDEATMRKLKKLGYKFQKA